MSSSVSHRKSTVPAGTSLNGNGAKYLSYREAWARIKLARRQGFFLEAVTIEESIISDRLLSFLEKGCGLTLRDATKGNLNQIVQKWHTEAAARLEGELAEAEAIKTLNARGRRLGQTSNQSPPPEPSNSPATT